MLAAGRKGVRNVAGRRCAPGATAPYLDASVGTGCCERYVVCFHDALDWFSTKTLSGVSCWGHIYTFYLAK